MKHFSKLLSLLLALIFIVGCFTACGEPGETPPQDPPQHVDYASEVKLDLNSGRARCEVTVKAYIDGDTTHFYVPTSIYETGILKARYLGVNTPESTGQIEPWGHKASDFTKSKLSEATSIIVESDTAIWNPDSTGERFLVWVWYKTADMTDYKCLNLEILQEGLARASKSSDTVYSEVCTKILNQAVTEKLHVFGKEKDPDFYYGSAMPITLKELKTNIEKYSGKSVSFEGVVAQSEGSQIYVEEYDEETGLYFGIQVYYGYSLDVFGTEILTVGNRVRIVGSVQYYEEGQTYQISDIYYNAMRPDDDRNIQLIEEGHEGKFQTLDAANLLNGKVNVEITTTDEEGEETVETKSFDVGFLTMHSTASLKNLTITDLYTTKQGTSKGAISITCKAEDGTEIVVRTIVLTDAQGNVIKQDEFKIGDVINVKGIVDYYNGAYQLKLFSLYDVEFVND